MAEVVGAIEQRQGVREGEGKGFWFKVNFRI
jgi:hypothetical protein